MKIAWNKLTHQDYLDRLNQFDIQVLPTEEYVDNKTKIQHKCVKCGNIINIAPVQVLSRLKKSGIICQVCGGKSLYVGKNDLWTTNPDIASLLVNSEDGYKTTKGSEKKLNWKCPKCNTIIKNKIVDNVVKHGLTCPICSKGKSMGHRIVNAILEYCEIDYDNEHTFSWSNNKRYDIYAQNECIIEIHGEQHYSDSYLLALSHKTIEEERENDKYKYQLAIQNNINYYCVIDARQSDYDFIINSIKLNKDFITYIDSNSKIRFDAINWRRVFEIYNDEIAWRVLRDYKQGKRIKDIAELNKINVNAVGRYLKILALYGFCSYDPQSQTKQRVKCITTNEVFDSMKEAGEKYHIQPLGIYRVCNGLLNRQTAGKLPDGTRLKWEYIKEAV